MASHPPQEKNSGYGEKTSCDVPHRHQYDAADDHEDPDQVALPGLCIHEGLSYELAALVVHWGPSSVEWAGVLHPII